MIQVSAVGVLVADAGVDRAAGQVGGRQRGGGGHHQRDEHERHAAAVGAQQRGKHAQPAGAAALGPNRRQVGPEATHRPATSRPSLAAASTRGSGRPRSAISRYSGERSTSSSWRALGGDAPVLEHDHLVGQRDRGHAVRDHERGAALHHLGKRLLDRALGRGVHAGGGVVQDQHARRRQQRAGDGHALALAAGQGQAALADQRLVAVRKAGDHLGQAGPGRGLGHVLVRGVRSRVGDVVAQRGAEQERVVGHQGDLVAQRLQVHVADVDSVDRDLPLIDVVQAWDEHDQRGLARAGGADHGHRPAGGHVQVDLAEYLGVRAVVAERHPAHAHVPAAGRQGFRAGRGGQPRLAVQDLEHAVARRHGALCHAERHAQHAHRARRA